MAEAESNMCGVVPKIGRQQFFAEGCRFPPPSAFNNGQKHLSVLVGGFTRLES